MIAGLGCSSLRSDSSPVFVVGRYHERERGSHEWLVLGWSSSEWGGAPTLGVKHGAAQAANRTEMEINLYSGLNFALNLSRVSGIAVGLGVFSA